MHAKWYSESNKSCPIVTIITVCKNSESTIKNTLMSVAQQEGIDGLIEHVVIDGASSDGTLDIVKQFSHITYISEPDKGIADAFNKGINYSNGKIIGFVHSDDMLSSKFSIAKIINAFNENPDVRVVVGALTVDGGIPKKRTRFFAKYKRFLLDFLPNGRLLGGFIPHPSMYVKRDVYDELGLYDISFSIAMDYEFILRLRKKRINMINIQDIIYEMSSGGVSNVMQAKAAAESFRACKMHDIFYPLCLARYLLAVTTRSMARIFMCKIR